MNKFSQFIRESERILITTHTSPDPDAVASVLLLGTTLKLNFPHKQIKMVLEEEPDSLDFLSDYDQIEFKSVAETTAKFRPDFFVMVDVNTYARCSRRGGSAIQQFIKEKEVKTATIDHHEPDGKDETDIYIDSGNPAAVQEVYELCFEQLKLKKPEGYARTTMIGLYSDTGGFIYKNERYEQTFQLAAELVAVGANIEAIKNQLNQFSEDQIRVIGELAVNLTHEGDYSYSFISDEFAEKWQELDKLASTLNPAVKQFINAYVRNVEGRKWGFVVYLNQLQGENMYSVSFRSEGGVRDVSKIARKLSGGGHKPSAGGKVYADSVVDAIEKVKKAIAQTA